MKDLVKGMCLVLVFVTALFAILMAPLWLPSKAEASPPPPEASIVRAIEANTRALEGVNRNLDRINDTLREMKSECRR